jgi:integrase
MNRSKCTYVFPGVEDPSQSLRHYTLIGQSRDMKRRVRFHKDAGLHTLRHTHLTEMGNVTDVFTLMQLAGPSHSTTTQRSVYPGGAAMTSAAQSRLDRQKAKSLNPLAIQVQKRLH